MKSQLYKILSLLSVLGFSLYWSLAFLWSVPDIIFKNPFREKIKLPKSLFVSEWKLFTPPFTNDYRLYYIARNLENSAISDTIEVLENISIKKKHKVPFNQKEIILDYLVNKNVIHLVRISSGAYKVSDTNSKTILESGKTTKSRAMSQINKMHPIYLTALFNFGWVVLKEHTNNIEGKEMKIVIKQKRITPFEEMENTNFDRTETTLFDSPYMSFQ